MNPTPFLVIAIAVFAASAHAELSIPDATKRPSSALVAPGNPGNSGMPFAMPPPPGLPTLRSPGNAAPVPVPGLKADTSADAFRSVQSEFQNWQVAAVLDDVAMLRTTALTPGLQSMTVKHGAAQTHYDGVTLTASVAGSTVRLTATKAGESRLVFVGSVQAVFPGAMAAAVPGAAQVVPAAPAALTASK